MASSGNTVKTIVVDLKLLPSDSVKNIQDLQTKIENLKSTLAGMKAAGLENSDTYIRLTATLKELQQAVRANQKVLRDSIREQQANGDSINALRAQIRNLRAEYENLSKAERESAQGTELLDKISTLTQELKGLEEAQLDFTRNVGAYKSALEGLPFGRVIAGFNSLSQGTGKLSVAFTNATRMAVGFGKQLLKLLANPFAMAFAAIVAVVTKLTDAFKKNDDAMTALQSLFSAFKPILDVINKAFSALADVLAKVINGVSAFVQKVTSFIPFLRQYAEAEEDVVRSSDQLEETERKHALSQAKRNKEVSDLRAKSVESDKYSFEQRKGFLQQAIDLEKRNLEEQRDDAKEKLRIAEREAALEIGLTELTQEAYGKLSDEKKNQLNQLRIAVVETETAFNDGTRRMKSQMSSFTKQEESERKQRAQQAAQARKERQKNEREALKELENMLIAGIRNLQDREIAQMKAGTQQQIAQLRERLQTEKNLTTAAKKAINDQIILLEADLQIKLSELREKQRREEWRKNLEDTRKYYQTLLGTLTTEQARVQVRLELNKIDTQLLTDALKVTVDEVEKTWKSALTDLNGDIEQGLSSLDYNQLAEKYGAVWEALGITEGDNISKMNQLVAVYYERLREAQMEYERDKAAAERAAADEAVRIQQAGYDKEWSLAVKHRELMAELLNSQALNEVAGQKNQEVERTRIMFEQAQERLRIAQDEYARLALMRQKYSDEELTAIYGSVEAYDNMLLESENKVVAAVGNVEQAIRDLDTANTKVKVDMISTAVSVMQAMGTLAGSFKDLFSVMAEGNEKYQKYANALALVEIMTNMAVGLASAVAKGMEMGWPAAAIMIPIGIATVVSGIANAISVFQKNSKVGSAPKFSEGGLVGNKTTRRKDDSVNAKLSLGEYVIPSDVVSDLGVDFFDKLTGRKSEFGIPKLRFAEGGLVGTPLVNPQFLTSTVEASLDYESVKDAMKEAVMEMPAPVVSVKEVTKAQKRVRVKETTARS